MSALDTFEWFVGSQPEGLTPEAQTFVREQRRYLFTLRSEDERQRFVEWAMGEIAAILRPDSSKTAKLAPSAVGK